MRPEVTRTKRLLDVLSKVVGSSSRGARTSCAHGKIINESKDAKRFEVKMMPDHAGIYDFTIFHRCFVDSAI